ncbi:MAG: DUF3883 domain-containing protein [Candidatus Caldarchaeum sp.]
MAQEKPKRISRGIDYLGYLSARLRDLQGFDTLAYELIQNADDSEGVSEISFNVTEDALIVENDGQFSDCGHSEDKECRWLVNEGHMCDFHRFRSVSSQDKRRQKDTTGAFGIGFSVVYQITDRPELISSGHHWIIEEWRSEDERIVPCPGCDECQKPGLPGTRFILPWARDPETEGRKKFNVEAVDDARIRDLLQTLDRTLPLAILFLRRVKRIQLKENGKIHKRIERLEESNSLIVRCNDSEETWHLLRKRFDGRAQELRKQYQGKIEDKRSAIVTVAIPKSPLESGVLCATLPTQHDTSLPFHINADFFTSSDRKRVIFEGDYQSEWNKAAIQTAAEALRDGLEDLAPKLGHKSFWQLLQSIREAPKKQFPVDFWDVIKPNLPNFKIVHTSEGKWVKPSEAFLLDKKDYTALAVLQGLGMQVVHKDLAHYEDILKESRVRPLAIENIIQALERVRLKDQDEKVTGSDIPDFLRSFEALKNLWEVIGRALKRSHQQEEDKKQLGKCSLALTQDKALHRCGWVYRADKNDIELFERLHLGISFLHEEAQDWEVIKDLCRRLDANTVINSLRRSANDLSAAWNERRFQPRDLLQWFKKHAKELDEQGRKALAQLPIFPSYRGLCPLTELVLPGDFEDPLGLTDLIDTEQLKGFKDFLKELGAKELTFTIYVTERVPQSFPNLDVTKKREVVKLLAERFSEIKQDKKAQDELRKLEIIECEDGKFYRPDQTYFPEIPVEIMDQYRAIIPKEDNKRIRELYRWLGVNSTVRVQDLERRIRELVSTDPTEKSKDKIRAILQYLGEKLDDYKKEEHDKIKQKFSLFRWLPAEGFHQWFAPNEVYTVFRQYIFSKSKAPFLDVPKEIQEKSRKLLDLLGVKTEPETKLVIEHLLRSSEEQFEVHEEVYKFLNEHVEDSEIHTLKDKPCLALKIDSQLKYVCPQEVFWESHPLEPFRYCLDSSWEDYRKLLNKIGVRQRPDCKDALAVLREIGQKYGSFNTKLDDEAYAVVRACWKMLSEGLKQDRKLEQELQSLRNEEVIPDDERLLKAPNWMFIADRADLARKFEALKHNLIPREEDVWEAWHAAGARLLSQCVDSEVQTGPCSVKDEMVKQRVQERQLELKRVLEAHSRDITKEINRILQIECYRTNDLKIRYILSQHETDYEEADAYLKINESKLYYVSRNGEPPWRRIASELAQAICPDNPGNLAAGFSEVLNAPSREEAKQRLDELGYLALEESSKEIAPDVKPVSIGASTVPLRKEVSPKEPPLAEAVTSDIIELPRESYPQTESETKLPQPSQPQERLKPTPSREKIEPRQLGLSREHFKPSSETPSPGPSRKRDQSRFPVYVSREDEGVKEADSSRDAQERNRVEEAAIEKVLEYERKQGRIPERKPKNYPGYDIESKDRSGNTVRYIEVKGLDDNWGEGGVALTDTQFEEAKAKGDSYWLYVVERATQQENYKIHRIQDPANKANRFFYDSSWRQVAEEEET